MQCLGTVVTLSQSDMITLTTDNSFVGKMQLSSINVQQTTVWSMVIPGKLLCPVEKCHVSINQSIK